MCCRLTLCFLFLSPSLFLFVACDDYTGTELPSLKFCCTDAARVRNVLESTLGYEVTTIGLNKECTISTFHAAFDELLCRFNGQSMASFVFYFAGHGVLCKRGKGWFALSGYDSKRPNTTSIRFSALKTLAASLGAVQQLFILDSCNSGKVLFESTRGGGEGECMRNWEQNMMRKPAIWAITAVDGSQNSRESDECGGGLFTSILVAGLLNSTVMTASQLLAYVQEKVSTASEGKQDPQGGRLLLDHFGSECTGEFILPRIPNTEGESSKQEQKQEQKQQQPIVELLTPSKFRRAPLVVQSDPFARKLRDVRSRAHSMKAKQIHVVVTKDNDDAD